MVVWFGVVLFSAAGLLLLFYTAALLLPIILAVFAVSLVVGWYRQARIKKAFENLKPFSAAEKQRSDPADGSRKLLTPNLRSLMIKTGKIRRLAVSYGKVEKLKIIVDKKRQKVY